MFNLREAFAQGGAGGAGGRADGSRRAPSNIANAGRTSTRRAPSNVTQAPRVPTSRRAPSNIG